MISLACAGLVIDTAAANSFASYDRAALCCSYAFWTFVAGAATTWLFLVALLTRLRREYSPAIAGEESSAALSWATWITIARGLVISVVAGFALEPAPGDGARWLPGVLYAVAALADRVDGALARRTNDVTALGAKLDVVTDAVGLFVAPLVGVRWGRLPPWYVALALAYPGFRLALRARRSRGLPVYLERLKRDPRARFFAGVQMVVVAAALLPVLPRALAWTAATVAMLPTLALFVGEWRLVTRP
jgi:CDP-diacylglycerol--glycerol-3-phosphate 3-phosphatidyltransferase